MLVHETWQAGTVAGPYDVDDHASVLCDRDCFGDACTVGSGRLNLVQYLSGIAIVLLHREDLRCWGLHMSPVQSTL
jgi:hypothetical protein